MDKLCWKPKKVHGQGHMVEADHLPETSLNTFPFEAVEWFIPLSGRNASKCRKNHKKNLQRDLLSRQRRKSPAALGSACSYLH